METIGQRARKRRRELRISVKDAAKDAGMAPTTLYDLENGGMNSTTRLHALARVLKCTPEYLETGKAGPLSVAEPMGKYRVRRELTDEEYELATEWSKLDEPAKTQILTMVESLVAKQIKAEKAGKRGKPPQSPDHN